VQRATEARLPTVFPADATRFNPMLNFGSSFVVATGRMADLVDKVLKGTRPGDIPIEVVKEHKLVVNRRVARTVGIEIPAELLARADSVID
jgi:putative ABC transport system substrate-binding protein